MSGLDLFIDDIDGRLFAAVVRKTVLTDLYADPLDMTASWASLYAGKVAKVDRALDAAIIDLGNGLQGILPAKHVAFPGSDVSSSRSNIGELLSPGQMIPVQIKSEGKRKSATERTKLPRLTMKLALMSQYLTYCPRAHQVTISRDVDNENILAVTAHLKGAGGWVVQKNAERADVSHVEESARLLLDEWKKLDDAIGQSTAPKLIKAGPDAITRIFTDYGIDRFDHIYVGNRTIFDKITAIDPALGTSKRLKLFKPEKPQQKLFDLHDIYGAIEELNDPLVVLSNGASIIIENTAALTVVDVNQGSCGNIFEANVSAAAELARQCRLRNLSGAILMDSIGMTQRTERSSLIEAMEKTFATEVNGSQVHGFTRLGLVEITRKRRTATLSEKLRA